MPRLKVPKPRARSFSLREFHEKHNKVLVMRETGGLGDILMHRMLFEDFKLLNPELELHFSCPAKYHEAVEDHPFLDKILDCRKTNTQDYIVFYVTTSACNRHEMAMAPFSQKHRADIWANHCGVELTKHNMHFKLDPKYEAEARAKLPHTVPTVALCPISAMITKNLTTEQQNSVVSFLKDQGCYVFGLHNKPIPELNAPVWSGLSIKEWMGALDAADYVVAVDSAAFHYAGGGKKPLTGIFSFADGYVYSKYYKSEIVQIHRDTHPGWCGPCYNWPNCHKTNQIPKPCLTEITSDHLIDGLKKMFNRWPLHVL